MSNQSKTFSKLISAVINNRHEQVQLHIAQHPDDLREVDSSGNTAFLLACRYCDVAMVQLLASCSQVDITAVDKIGRNALFYAIQFNQSQLAVLLPWLLTTAIDVNQSDQEGHCPLFLMIRSHNHHGLQVLLEQSKVKLTQQDAEGNTALLLATSALQLGLVHCLVAYGADINHRNKMGSTALMLSILQHQPNMVRYFLDSQADINLLDNAGVSALQLAIESKQVDIVRMLLEKPHIHCNHQDMRSKSMLLLALERLDQCDPDYSVVTLLLLRGVNVNLQDEDGEHALKFIVRRKKFHLVDTIFQHGFNAVLLSLPMLDELLCYANQRRAVPLLRQLLEYKSVIDIVDKNQVHISNVDNEQILLAQDVNELLFAVHSDEFQQHQSHPRLAMKRFKYIYNVFEAAEREKEIVWEGRINAEGETIFLHAIKQGLLLLAFSLVAFGVDVDSARQDGTTSLILSAKKGWLEIVRWLVEMDCNVEAVGGVNQNTALIEAAYEGHIAIVQYLIASGANALARNKFGETAAHVSMRRHGPSFTSKYFFGRDPSIKDCHQAVDSELDRLAVIEARTLEKELFQFDEDFQAHAESLEGVVQEAVASHSEQQLIIHGADGDQDDNADTASHISFDFFAASDDEEVHLAEDEFPLPVGKRSRY